MNRLLKVTIAFLAYVCLAAVALGQVPGHGLTFTIGTGRSTITSGDNIEISVSIKNEADVPVPFAYSGDPYFDLGLTVIDYAGNHVPQAAYDSKRRANLRSPSRWITSDVAPGIEIKETIDLPDYFDLSAPGVYSIQAYWPGGGTAPADALLKSNLITVTVEPAVVSQTAGATKPSAASGALFPPATRVPLSLTIETDKPKVFVGRNIYVSYKLINPSSQTVSLPPGTSTDYVVEARDQAGDLVPDDERNVLLKARISHAEGDPNGPPMFKDVPMAIRPGSWATGSVLVNAMLNITSPGLYVIQLWRKVPENAGGGEIRSNVIEITVVPAAQ